MSLTDHRESADRTARRPTGLVDVSEMTAAELRAFVDGSATDGEIGIQRRGASAYLLTE